jgi:DNA primase
MDDQVAEIKSRTDIVSIIGERIELKKAGRNYKATCPFHGEKTPSFMVSPELQIFKCFGCNEAGDVYSFLEKYEGMEFPEALKYLADRVGIKLVRENFGQA